jgi:hypothetical protein
MLSIIWSEYLKISIIVWSITITIVAIVYMFGKLLRKKEIEDYATGEFYQGIASAFIIATIMILIAIINNTILAIFGDVGFSCSGNICNYSTTEVKGKFSAAVVPKGFYLEEKNESCTQEIWSSNRSCHMAIARARLDTINNVVKAYTASKLLGYGYLFTLESVGVGLKTEFLGAVVNVTTNVIKKFGEKLGVTVSDPEKYTGTMDKIGTGVGIVSRFLPKGFVPFSWISIIRESFKTVFSVLYTISIYLSGVDLFLQFVEVGIFPIFFVSGIILRTFTPTRRLGGLLIAIAIGVYLIFPMLTILVSLIAPNTTFELEDFEKLFVSEKTGTSYPFPISLFVLFKNISGTGLNLPSYFAVNLFKVFEKAAILFVWVFVQQLIVIYATVISIREISQFLGGDIEIAGLTKLL